MNNLFGALDVAEIPEFPDDGTHEYVLKVVKSVKTQSGENKLVMEFVLDDEDSPFNGNKFAKWFNLPWIDQGIESVEEFDTKCIQAYQKLKKWLLDLNVPEDELKTFDFGELTGTRVQGYGFKRDRYNSSGQEYFLANVKVI
jgi:hypothetical protein